MSRRSRAKLPVLTPKQQDFIDCFLGPAAGNAFQAAQMAGYHSGSVGAEVLQIPDVQLVLAQRATELAQSGAMSPLEIHAFWRRVMDGSEGGGVTISDKIQVSKLVAQALGMFIQRTESINHNFEHNAERINSIDALVEQLDDEETEALIEFIRWKKSRKAQFRVVGE